MNNKTTWQLIDAAAAVVDAIKNDMKDTDHCYRYLGDDQRSAIWEAWVRPCSHYLTDSFLALIDNLKSATESAENAMM